VKVVVIRGGRDIGGASQSREAVTLGLLVWLRFGVASKRGWGNQLLGVCGCAHKGEFGRYGRGGGMRWRHIPSDFVSLLEEIFEGHCGIRGVRAPGPWSVRKQDYKVQ